MFKVHKTMVVVSDEVVIVDHKLGHRRRMGQLSEARQSRPP